ncbi:hypothetical protein M1D47_11330 [Bacillus sp. R1-10]
MATRLRASDSTTAYFFLKNTKRVLILELENALILGSLTTETNELIQSVIAVDSFVVIGP